MSENKTVVVPVTCPDNVAAELRDMISGHEGPSLFALAERLYETAVRLSAAPASTVQDVEIEYTPGEWFKARTLEEMQAFYMSRLPAIREAAKEHGYAIGLHGSTRRDFDLMAMQWREDASDKGALAHAIAVAACGITREGAYQWEQKPSGRFAVSIPICWTDHANPDFQNKLSIGHIDLSVIDQRTTVAAPRNAQEPNGRALYESSCASRPQLEHPGWDDLSDTGRTYWNKRAAALTAAQEVQKRDAGLEDAAAWIDERRFAFEREHGSVDPSTGTLEFGTGQRAQLQEEYAAELAEIAEGIRSLKYSTLTAPQDDKDQLIQGLTEDNAALERQNEEFCAEIERLTAPQDAREHSKDELLAIRERQLEHAHAQLGELRAKLTTTHQSAEKEDAQERDAIIEECARTVEAIRHEAFASEGWQAIVAGTIRALATAQPAPEQSSGKLKPGHCHKCGLPLVENPHPEAGKPNHYLEVGCPAECLPCTVLSRHQWAARASRAEMELWELRASIIDATAQPAEKPEKPKDFAAYMNALLRCDSEQVRQAAHTIMDWYQGAEPDHIADAGKMEKPEGKAEQQAEPDNVPYLIMFDDADRKPEIYLGRKAAMCRYEQISVSWNAHLYVKVDSNSADCPYPSAHPPAQPQQLSDEDIDKARNALLWFYRRATSIYGRLPFAEEAIAILSRQSGEDKA
jgi:hypothetical protein